MSDLILNSKHLIFKEGMSLALLLRINKKSKLYECIIKRRNIFDLDNSKYEPHITLHIININMKHPLANTFIKIKQKIIKNCFLKKLNSKLSLKSLPGNYELLGDNDYAHYARIYKPNNTVLITKFRTCLYDKIGTKLNTTFTGPNNINDFNIFYSNNKPLYAIKNFYYGKNNWKPHISIFQMREKSKRNRHSIKKNLSYKIKKNVSNLKANNFQQILPKNCLMKNINSPLINNNNNNNNNNSEIYSIDLSMRGKNMNKTKKIRL